MLEGDAPAESVGGWTRDIIIQRIRNEADRQNVDPDLAVAVATQESSLKPDNHGDNGKSRGLFHLQEKAAIDAGINPKWRDDPGVNIYGGVRYLRQKLDQSGGNVEQALSRYNRGTPDYRGIGDPNYVNHVLRHYNPEGTLAKQQPTLWERARKFVQPASAEAATPGGRDLTTASSQPSSAGGGRDFTDLLFGAQQPPQATTPSPPTARSTPEQDAAYRASRGQQEPATASQTAPSPPMQPGASQTPPAPSPDPSATPGMRFQALPSITQLEPADRIQKTLDFERLKPELQEEFVRSEEPAAGGLAVGGGPVAQSQPVTDPAAALAMGRRAAGWREGDPLPPDAKRPPTPTEAPVTEGITAPSTMIPLLMPGAGVKAVAPLLSKAGPLITRGARAAAEGLSQTAGWTAGRTAETGEVPSAGEIGTEAALNVATGGVIEGLGAGRQALLRRSQAGRAIQQEGQAVIPEAYTQAIEGQRQAIQTARAVPGRYTPETPSWTMYERFNDVAKNQEVDLLTAKTALADVRAGRGVLPDGSLRPFPQSVEKIATSLEGAGDVASVQTIQQELRRLGPLTRHADGNIRGPAKQLYGIYADALESSPAANDLLRSANATFRKEMALQDVQEWLRPGHGVIRIDNQGREVINPGQLMTRLEKKIGDDTLFARSFSPEELQSLRTDIGSIAGTPTMPRGGPPAGPTAKEILGKQPAWKGHTTTLGSMAIIMSQIGVPAEITTALTAAGAVHVAQQQGRWLLANALLNPKRRALMNAAIDGRGGLNPRLYGFLIATLSPEEKQAYERETKAKGR